MEQQQRLKKVTEKLTTECWDLCVSNPGVAKLDNKTETCLVNCVDRFLDTSQFILNEFSKRNQSATSSSSSFSSSSSSSFATDSDLILEDKFSSDSSSASSTSDKSKSGSSWKFW